MRAGHHGVGAAKLGGENLMLAIERIADCRKQFGVATDPLDGSQKLTVYWQACPFTISPVVTASRSTTAEVLATQAAARVTS